MGRRPAQLGGGPGLCLLWRGGGSIRPGLQQAQHASRSAGPRLRRAGSNLAMALQTAIVCMRTQLERAPAACSWQAYRVLREQIAVFELAAATAELSVLCP